MPDDDRSTTQGDLFFESLASSYVANNPRFLRRDWLAEEVDARMAEPDCRFVLLTAEPGAGKTSFMAQLAADHPPASGQPTWLRYFIRRDQRTPLGDVGVRSFLLRIGYQLVALHPDLFTEERVQLSVEQRIGEVEAKGEVVGAEIKRILASPFYQKAVAIRQHVERNAGRVVGLKLEELVIETRQLDASDLQYTALLDPARALLRRDPAAQIVVLVDALDEIRYHGGEDNILKWLTNCPELPPNVHFVLSSRPPDDALKVFCQKQAPTLRSLTITPEDLRVQLDMQVYARRLATRPDVAAELVQLKKDADVFVAQAVDKANGNIGYLDALERAIDAALARSDGADRTILRALLDLSHLPDELGALNGFFIRQVKTAVAGKVRTTDPETGETIDFLVWPEVYSRILGVLAVALAPLGLEEIIALGGIKAGRDYAVEAMNWLLQFLDIEAGGYSFYHAMLPEFLAASATKEHVETTDLWIDAVAWNRQIANYYWRTHRQDWRRCDAYGLNSLAVHMARGSQPDRLRELIDQSWMAARFEGSNYTYDGFIADLDLAWRQANDQTLRQIDAGEEPSAIADCVRYALIRTSINSLSVNYVPELVARAIETGLWPAERALSLAIRVPDAKKRVDLYLAALKTEALTEAQRQQALAQGLAAAVAIDDEESRAQVLTALAPQLTGELLERGFAAVRAIDKERYRTPALAALAPQLMGGLLKQGLEADLTSYCEWFPEYIWIQALATLVPQLSRETRAQALAQGLEAGLAISSEWDRVQALVALAPQLIGEAREQALAQGLAAALAIGVLRYRVQALAALAPQLSGEARVQALARGLEAALAISSEWYRVQALVALAPQLTGGAREQALTQGLSAALTINDERYRAQALAFLAPQLTGKLLAQEREAALTINDERYRALVRVAVATQLTGEAREHALTQELEAALTINDDRNRAHVLAALAPQLSGKFLEQGLAAALAINNEESRAHVLAALARQLSGKSLEQGLEAALTINDETCRVQALVALAPQLSGEAREQALTRGLEAVLAIDDEESRVQALVALAPLLLGELLAQGLAAALAIGDERYRVQALTAMAPNLTGELLEQGLTVALAIDGEESRAVVLVALAPQLTGKLLEQGLAAALAIGDEMYRVQVLTVLAQRLTGEAREHVLEQGLAATLAIDGEESRAVVLVALAPQLTGKLLEQGLAAALAIGVLRYRVQALTALVPRLTGELLEQGLAAALAIGDERYRVQVLTVLAQQLTGEAREHVLAQGLESALAISGKRSTGLWQEEVFADHGEKSRAMALAALAPQLTGELLEQGLAAALAIGDEGYRVQALTALVPRLSGEARARALEAVLAISDEAWRVEVLTALLRHSLDDTVLLSHLQRAITAHLYHSLGKQDRAAVLGFVASKGLLAPPVVETGTTALVSNYIIEICSQWRWL